MPAQFLTQCSAVTALALLSFAASASAQGAAVSSTSPSTTFSKARSLYYTPVDAGLRGFHCDVDFNWKQFLEKASNQAVPDGDPRLAYLRTIQMSVDDELRGSGELHWKSPAPAPDGTEDSVSKMRDGTQQMWAGFFQSWNGFITGDMMVEDVRATVERNAAGYHVAARSGSGLAEEQYDDKLLLQTVHVVTPSLESTLIPGFTSSPHGLLVTSLRSVYRQPPDTQPTEVFMKINYVPVGTFQIPSELSVAVGPANFDFKLANCTVTTQLTQK